MFLDENSSSKSEIFSSDNFSKTIEKSLNISKKSLKINDIEELKRVQNNHLTLIKQKNITKEQTIKNSLDLKYRNIIWDLTLQHFGKGFCVDDLTLYFQRKLDEEEFKLQKELIKLEEEFKKETNYNNNFKEKPLNNFKPYDIAKIIFNQIEPSLLDSMNFDSKFNKLKKKIKKIKNLQINKNFNLPEFQPEIFSKKKNNKLKKLYIDPKIQKHITERKKFEKVLDQADNFLKKMKNNLYSNSDDDY